MDQQQTNSQESPSTPPPPIIPPEQPNTAQQAPPPPPRRRSTGWRWILGCGCLVVLGLALFMGIMGAWLGTSATGPSFGPKVALINVSGPIVTGTSGGLFGGGMAASETIISDLRRAEEDKQVRAIVLRIDSPGGSATASQEIYQEVMRVRSKGKPVIVSMGSMATSGGYYIAAAADEIVANSSTITGSIGVIVQSTDMSELFNKIGLRPETVTSGEHKDMFSPGRPLTEVELAMAKEMVLDIYDQFVDDVVKGRENSGLTREELIPIADGRIFTGRQALELKLVDRLGSLEDTLLVAGEKVGISGRPSIWRVRRSFWDQLAEASSNLRPSININLDGQSGNAVDRMLQSNP